MIDYFEYFKKDPYVRVSKLYNLITIFDASFYSRNDYEILSPPQRKYIIEKLLKTNHQQKSGKVLQHNISKRFLKFTDNVGLGISPLDALERVYNQEDIFIVTPGTYFLFLLQKYHQYQAQEIIDEIIELIQKQPVNLQQLFDLSKYAQYKEIFAQNLPKFNTIQSQVIDQELKHKKPLGHLFS